MLDSNLDRLEFKGIFPLEGTSAKNNSNLDRLEFKEFI